MTRSFSRALVALSLCAIAVAQPAGARAPEPDCRPVAIPVLVDKPPVGTQTCPGVRPGALVETPIGFCTFNFLFKGSDGRRYIGTAGHCILGDPEDPFAGDAGERTWARGRGPLAKDAIGRRIGEFAYAILKEPKDFALIRIDRGITSKPGMCWFGGPTGINTTITDSPTTLRHFGNGIGIGDVLPARSAVARAMPSPHHVYAYGTVTPGDSGSGIISADGRAVGVIVTTGLHFAGFADNGLMGVTRLAPQLARAAKMLKIKLTLVTASLQA